MKPVLKRPAAHRDRAAHLGQPTLCGLVLCGFLLIPMLRAAEPQSAAGDGDVKVVNGKLTFTDGDLIAFDQSRAQGTEPAATEPSTDAPAGADLTFAERDALLAEIEKDGGHCHGEEFLTVNVEVPRRVMPF